MNVDYFLQTKYQLKIVNGQKSVDNTLKDEIEH